MPLWILVCPLLAFAIAWLLARPLPRRGAFVVAGIFVAVGAASFAWFEQRYATENTTSVMMPLDLSRSGTAQTPPFRAAFTGPYAIWLQFDHTDDVTDFDCWVGTPGMETPCPKAEPSLGLAWTVAEEGRAVARGGTDWSNWDARQSALAPDAMARSRRRFLDYQAKSTDPANHWPLFWPAGGFAAQAGDLYQLEFKILKPGGRLAALRPRLVVGLAPEATEGLGVRVMVFALLWILAGGGLALAALRRGAPA